jgi:hypothetical protein
MSRYDGPAPSVQRRNLLRKQRVGVVAATAGR